MIGSWQDEADLARKAGALRAELDLDALLVTRSEEGMTLFGKDETVHEGTRAREVYDVSGAGDTVIADARGDAGCRLDYRRCDALGQPCGRHRRRQAGYGVGDA